MTLPTATVDRLIAMRETLATYRSELRILAADANQERLVGEYLFHAATYLHTAGVTLHRAVLEAAAEEEDE